MLPFKYAVLGDAKYNMNIMICKLQWVQFISQQSIKKRLYKVIVKGCLSFPLQFNGMYTWNYTWTKAFGMPTS